MTNTKPLVSTITPCFRMERYLKTFLDELPNQTIFEQVEVVLDHNEPTEQELQWVREFQEKYPNRLKHIIIDPVEPIGASMNRCIREANGKYLAIWNVDDLRTPDSLEKQVAVLEEGYDITYGNFLIVNSFPSKTGKFADQAYYHQWPVEYYQSMILGPFPMWKKTLHEKAGMFDEQLESGADFDLAIRLAAHGSVFPTHGIVGYYLDEGRGASTRGDGKQPLERTLIEIRYGADHKVDPTWSRRLGETSKYTLDKIKFNGKEHDVAEFFTNYEAFKSENVKPQ